MPDWSIAIIDSGGQTQFLPNPLDAKVNDTVSWGNRTTRVQSLAISGVAWGDIQPGNSSDLFTPTSAGVVTYTCTSGSQTARGTINVTVLLLCFLLMGLFTAPARAQSGTPIDCAPLVGQPLQPPPTIGRIDSDPMKPSIVRGSLVTAGTLERIAVTKTLAAGPVLPNIQCFQQWFRAYSKDQPRGSQDPRTTTVLNPLPGPIIRGRVGDLVELTFVNAIDKTNFNKADSGRCDQNDKILNGQKVNIYPGTDKYPDCFNESIITNVHYHGTHTNPSSTGDNVFLEIAPWPRDPSGNLLPDFPQPRAALSDFFTACEAQYPAPRNTAKQWPRLFSQAPQSYQNWVNSTVQNFGPAGWFDQNQRAVLNGAWPQYLVGAAPYCFQLPDYTPATWPPAPQASLHSAHAEGAGSSEHDVSQDPTSPLIMGQAPGTHWYHAHKHGSTTINVSNGMTGVFIIEGKYDDEIDDGYGKNITKQVMVIQQIGGLPHLERGSGTQPYFSVNGQLQPTIAMRPGEVQMWRIANTSSRAGAFFLAPTTQANCLTTTNTLAWKQLAQDGVQFNDTNYNASWNNCGAFLLASGNRADLLVKAPSTAGTYAVLVNNTVDPSDRGPTATKLTLLNVIVSGTANSMIFLPHAPSFPPFLADIQASEVKATRRLVFASSALNATTNAPPPPSQHTIDGKLFDGEVGAAVVMNQVEEWTIVNETYPKPPSPLQPPPGGVNVISHPFHIHINPFQLVEIFDPNATLANGTPVYITSGTPGTGQCLISLTDPSTWHPCSQVSKPANIWWDVFSIPSGKVFNNNGTAVPIPGYFRMRSRFVDFAGYYVLHCHILAHEDRGMMTVVYVTPLQPPFSHH
jgi:FtsP/CotA-like multicopper oxidase with cupredoxin domain